MGVVWLRVSNGVGPRLEVGSRETRNRQVREQLDPRLHHREGLTEGQRHLGFREVDLCRIVNAPMRSDRFARPARMDFACCVVANGENEVEGPCPLESELAPAFAAQTVS